LEKGKKDKKDKELERGELEKEGEKENWKSCLFMSS
jgi:hypothetical protein